MYLKELRLNGFKSFADLTRLEFQPGVTAIVGPNGCGKSNIADAIRWVLGEQSAKSLRAGAMQDVIFQGTTHRKAVNLCEVVLVFSDCEEQLGTAYNEVEISRRVLRDGGSEYLLNGKQCRLKDIQRLFLDTGVGQVSYSFMLQGQIDQVLSSNPSERRAIFEEAAGISKYKAQRREALGKLSHVDANLARVTDVIEEVSRRIGSLKRQASKALRYKRVHHRLSHLELANHGFRFGRIKEELVEVERKITFFSDELGKLEAALTEVDESLAQKRESRKTLQENLQTAQKAVYEMRNEKEAAENRSQFAEVRKKDLDDRIKEIETELADLDQQIRIVSERLAGEIHVKKQQMELFGNSDELFQNKEKELLDLQKNVGESETEFARAKQALMVKEGAISRLRSNCTTLEVDLKTYQVRHANLTEEIQQLGEEGEVLEKEVSTLEMHRGKRQEDKEKRQVQLAEAREGLAAMTTEFRELQQKLQETGRQGAGLQAQIQVLADLQAKFEGFSEGARAILQGQLESVVDAKALLVFQEQLQVEAKYTKALETLLGAATDGLFFDHYKQLGSVADKLSSDKLGQASLLVEHAVPKKSLWTSSVKACPDLIPAAKAVGTQDSRLTSFLQNYLDGCYFCESLATFLAFWEENPGFVFHNVVTLDGELVDHRGIVLAGQSKKKKENASYLARQNQLKVFRKDLKDLKANEESFRLQVEKVQARIDTQEKRIEDHRKILGEIGDEITTLVAQRQSAEKNRDQTKRSLAIKQADLVKEEKRKTESTERLDKAQAELKSTEEDIEAQKRTVESCEKAVEEARGAREALRESFNEVRLEMAEKKQRLAVLDRGLEELQNQSREMQSTKVKRRQEIDTLKGQIDTFAGNSKEEVAKAAEIGEKLQSTLATLEKNRLELKQVEQSIEAIEMGVRSKRENQQKTSTELNKLEVQRAKQESQIGFIVDELQREYQIEPTAIHWREKLWYAGDALPDRIRVDIEEESPEDFEPDQDRGEPSEEDLAKFDSTDWDEVMAEIENLRGRIQAMGPVNLVAIEEYKELKERHDFLKTQSDDLWASKEQLLQAIDEINATSQEMFAKTFDQIRTNFVYTFETLFGGGKSDLKLTDGEDVLESGIEITAQPPGTRLRSLALLSGGQKTMTAVALLFAIYMVKPSPFCVLDEIDAPLDDANIGRFTKMLEGFLEFSQFLIITHSKRTISVADTIYGATMQEKGVSRMVSMRFNKSTGTAEAVTEIEEDGAGI